MDGHSTTAILVKSWKGKTDFTGNTAIGAPVPHPKYPPMSRRVFGTLRSSNVPFKSRTVPPARKMEKDSVGFPEKMLRNPRKDNVTVRQNPVASSPVDKARARVANPKLKLRSSPPSLVPKTSSRKTGHVDPEHEKSVRSPEKSQNKLEEDNLVVPQVPLASSPGSTVKHRVSNLNLQPTNGSCTPSEAAKKSPPMKATDLEAKPKNKSIRLSGTPKKNPTEDDEAEPQTPVDSSPRSAALSAAERPSSDVKPGETCQKSKDKRMRLLRNSRENDMVVLVPAPVVSYAEKTSDLGLKPKKKKKSVCFQDRSPRLPRTEDALLPRTPLAPPPCSAVKPRTSGTPYHTAESCRGCRLDRLETASYWLAQIKLAESAMKHFVSATFFHLAFESKAKPVRNLLVELRQYLARHARLSEHPEWKDVSLRYGLAKDVGGDCSARGGCSVTRDIGLIKNTGKISNGQGDLREDIGEEPRERPVASPPGIGGEGN